MIMTLDCSYLLDAAKTLGHPRLSVKVPGRRWPIPIEPTPQAWDRFGAWFERDAAALDAAWRGLVEWECFVRAELVTVEASDAS